MSSTQFIKDEKKVPTPKSVKRMEIGEKKKILNSLDVGDSFFMPNESTYGTKYKNLFGVAKQMGIKITGRSIEGGLRVWRLE